jgi:predicted nucleotidyltransferase
MAIKYIPVYTIKMLLLRLAKALNDQNIKYALVGGYAVALHGAVRGTVDIDLVVQISAKSFLAVEQLLATLGFRAQLPVTAKQVFEFREDYIENRNLIAWSFVNLKVPSEVVDIILTTDLRDIRTVKKSVGGLQIPVISISDLIKMKTQAARPQDLEDIQALEKLK